MYRGTDAGILINTSGNIKLTECDSLQVTLKQGEKIIKKGKGDCIVTDDSVTCTFTREETFSLHAGTASVDITGVIRGKAFALPAESISVYSTNRNEVIT